MTPFSRGGGGGGGVESQKTPALGLVWSTQIACRIALKKEDSVDFDEFLSVPPVTPARVGGGGAGGGVGTTKEGIATRIKDEKIGTEVNALQSSPALPSTLPSQNDAPKNIISTPTPVLATTTSGPPMKSTTRGTTSKTKRRLKLVFAPWTAGVGNSTSSTDNSNDTTNISNTATDEVEFEIWKGGIRTGIH